ncbi:unnamed protein product [Camellia sinensis]
MKNFNDFIDLMEVTELDMLGRKYTWCNAAEEEKWSKIDRFLLSPEWLLMFKFKVWGLPRVVSDHCPMILMEDTRDWGPRPFRFINAWVLHTQFLSVVKKAWEEAVVSGWTGYRIFAKLKAVKVSLKQWNLEVFGDINHKLKLFEEELHELDLVVEVRDLDDGEVGRRRELRGEVLKWSKRKEWLWLQKSRLSWALKGDKNTKFFHSIASCRCNRNLLNSLTVNGVVIENLAKIKEGVFRHFSYLFVESWKVRPKLGGVFKTIRSNGTEVELEYTFSEGEIWAPVKECDGNKAPGPNGFNLSCFQKCWKVFKEEMVYFFNEFHCTGRLAKCLTCSFVTLVPKKDCPAGLTDFRPISLIGTVYKILSKVLANRLKRVISMVVSKVHSAFVQGRNIFDGVLIANEILD